MIYNILKNNNRKVISYFYIILETRVDGGHGGQKHISN